MPVKLFKEVFVGKYNGVAPPTGLSQGSIVGGSNMRKVSPLGGWKVRKGCTYHNSTTIAEATVLSLHQFTHPRNADYHFLAQCNGNLYDATNDPPTGGTTFAASALTDLAAASQAGFSDVVDESWLYADGDGAPIMWGGDSPFCVGFMVYDNETGSYLDQTRKVRDQRSDTYAIVLAGASDKFYVCSSLPASSITLDLGSSVNSNAVTLTVKDFNGAWAAVASATDGTADSGATLAIDGTISWTPGGDEKKCVVGGIMGFWYELSWSGALSGLVHVVSCKVAYSPARLVNKWDGVYELPLSVRFYDQSADQYIDYSGKLSNQSTSQYLDVGGATTSDYIYLKTVEPIFSIGFGVVDQQANTSAITIDLIEYWDGDSFESVGTLTDGTKTNSKSLAQSGIIQWHGGAYTPVKRSFEWDQVPGYWYRISWDGAPSSDTYVFFLAVGSHPDELSEYDGVVEFKGRTMLWGDPEYANRLRFSAYYRPDGFSGSDSGWTEPFGDGSVIVCAKRFYNELIVWKARSIWLLEGYSPRNFGTLRIADTVGCCAPHTCHVVEAGFPGMHADEPLTIAIWMDTDGVYVLDGRKPRKISLPVDHFFNTEYSTAIAATNLSTCRAYVDPMNNEYHLLIPDGRELVYNYVTDEWYPSWSRRVGGATQYLACGLSLRGSDGRYYTYGGNNGGEVFRLEYDTTDKDENNADVVISHSLKTRAIGANPQASASFEFWFRELVLEAKARAAGSVTVKFFKDLATSGTTLATPGAPSLIRSGYGVSLDGVQTSQAQCTSFQIEFSLATADVELEIWAFLYKLSADQEIVIA